ncbi:MAG TPA: hypothetical protein VG013_26685 [Gemmataceae bacterium]|nr:hypothetical protein [Gemmataceae bacterium]
MLQSAPEAIVRFPPGFNFDAERQASKAGFLDGVTVELPDGLGFSVCLIDSERLGQEIDAAQGSGKPFFAKPGLIVVSRISAWIATLAVRWAASQDYFTGLNPVPHAIQAVTEVAVSYPDGFDLDSGQEAEMRGYLEGVTVQLGNGLRYLVCFMTPIRLRHEIEADAINGRPFYAEPGLIAVSDIQADLMNLAVRDLARQGFFSHLKPCEVEADPESRIAIA